MFSTVNHSECLNQAVADVGHFKLKQENQSKASDQHQTLVKEGVVHIKHMQSNKMNII